MYARVKLAVQPLKRGGGFVIDDAIVGGIIPSSDLLRSCLPIPST